MALISIKITDPWVCEALQLTDVPGAKTPIDEYHCTLLYLGDDYNSLDFYKATEVVGNIVASTPAFTGYLEMISHFPPKRGQYPVVCPVESIELQDLQQKLHNGLEKAQLPFSKSFRLFRPHVTLSFSMVKPVFTTIMRPWHCISLQVNEVSMWPSNSGPDGEVNLSLCKYYENSMQGDYLPCYNT